MRAAVAPAAEDRTGRARAAVWSEPCAKGNARRKKSGGARGPAVPRGVRLFVYGSLLRGEDNAHVIASARFVGEARTAPGFTLVDLGPYPALVRGGDTGVAGEIYEVDAAEVAALDDFEGHPDLYVREPIGLDDCSAAAAYLLPAGRAAGFPVIAGGAWRERRGGSSP